MRLFLFSASAVVALLLFAWAALASDGAPEVAVDGWLIPAALALGALTKALIALLERPALVALAVRIIPDRLHRFGPLARFTLSGALPVLAAWCAAVVAGLPAPEAVTLAFAGVTFGQGFHRGPRALEAARRPAPSLNLSAMGHGPQPPDRD